MVQNIPYAILLAMEQWKILWSPHLTAPFLSFYHVLKLTDIDTW